MSEKLGEAVLTLRTDDRQLDAGIDRAERKSEGLAKKFDAMGTRAKDVGAKLSIGLTAPLALFGVGAIKAASDAQEMESAFAVSFGNASAAAKSWAETTGNAMGRSTQEMMGMAASFQDILKKQMDPAAAVEMSKQLTVLTQDLASFKNLSNEDAKAKIFSGLIGEMEPLRAVGVVIDEAATKAQALKMGFKGVNGELTQGEKVQARAALIMAQLSDAQGDVMRTSGSTANQLKASNAAWEELNVTLGTKLLPVVTPLITTFAGLLNAFTGLPPGVQTFTLGLLATGAAIGPLLMGVGAISSGIGALVPLLVKIGPALAIIRTGLLAATPLIWGAVQAMAAMALTPVGAVITAIAVAVGLVYLAWKNWDKIAPIINAVGAAVTGWWSTNVQPVLDAVMAKLQLVANFWRDVFGAAIKGVVNVIGALLRGDFAGAFEAARAAVSAMVTGALALLNGLAPGATEAMRAMYLGVKQWTQDKLGAVFDWLKGKLESVGKWFKDLYIAVVGNSYWPDMIDGIGAHTKRLQPEMVAPIRKAISDVEGAFAGLKIADFGIPDIPPVDGPDAPTDDPATKQSWTEQFRQTFKDGVKAALSGDLAGFLKNFFQRAAERGLDRAIDGLFDVLGEVFKGSGGIGGLLGSIFGNFAGGFYKGGTIPSGSWGIVGERGPEPAIGTSRGTKILPNSTLRGMGGGGTSRVEIYDTTGLFRTRVEEISGDQVKAGIGSYDRVVPARVQDDLWRRG